MYIHFLDPHADHHHNGTRYPSGLDKTFDLSAIVKRLNDRCGTGDPLTLPEAQDLRDLTEYLVIAGQQGVMLWINDRPERPF
jgi:hypothetical protein